MTLTFSPLRAAVMTYYMQQFKVNGQSVPKIEWKQTDGGDCITSVANAVSEQLKLMR